MERYYNSASGQEYSHGSSIRRSNLRTSTHLEEEAKSTEGNSTMTSHLDDEYSRAIDVQENDQQEAMEYLSLVNMGPEESHPVDRSRSIFDLMDERK